MTQCISALDEEAQTNKPFKKSAADAEPYGDIGGLIEMRRSMHRLADVVLSGEQSRQLESFMHEQRNRSRLRQHGHVPNCRILLTGPPGSGKTMTAEALSDALGLPLIIVRIESLMSRYMGETAARLRRIFDEVARWRATYLFDEFDAIGGARDAIHDIGEIRRVLNALLQFMEWANTTDSVMIAATNYPALLDHALIRRFNLILQFDLPDQDQIKKIIELHLADCEYEEIAWHKIFTAAEGLSQSEIVQSMAQVLKNALLHDKAVLTTEDLTQELALRQAMRRPFETSAPSRMTQTTS